MFLRIWVKDHRDLIYNHPLAITAAAGACGNENRSLRPRHLNHRNLRWQCDRWKHVPKACEEERFGDLHRSPVVIAVVRDKYKTNSARTSFLALYGVGIERVSKPSDVVVVPHHLSSPPVCGAAAHSSLFDSLQVNVAVTQC